MARISSSIEAADTATAGVSGVSSASKTTVNFSQSNISGMKAGKDVANQVLDDLDKLVSCVKTQAGKFKQLATVKKEFDASQKNNFNLGGH
ncbi:MAG: hypothetical protein LBI13_05895 [Streptococcaceae bacterium]|jgi:hypothetical protein|nr:hypothetical protein [Streptococcaceae bacterium]